MLLNTFHQSECSPGAFEQRPKTKHLREAEMIPEPWSTSAVFGALLVNFAVFISQLKSLVWGVRKRKEKTK